MIKNPESLHADYGAASDSGFTILQNWHEVLIRWGLS